jgi:hypothetical protein
MGSYGIKVSRRGYDVLTAADRELLFNSSWPLLKIHSSGSFTINDTGAQTLITHSLGYYPAYLVMVDQQLGNLGSEVMFVGLSQHVRATTSVLKWTAGAGTWTGAINCYYYIFAQDLEVDFTAPTVNTSDTTADDDDDYGIRITKEGSDVSSTDYRDYVVHSGTRTSMVHMVTHGSAAGVSTTVVTHNLGYEPVYMVYGKLSGYDGYLKLGSADDLTITATTTTISFTSFFADAWDYSVLVLKDKILTQ